MTPRGWLAVATVAAATIVALSFVDGWIAQNRELTGEGYRRVHVDLNAWRGAAVPVLSAAIVAAAGAGLGAAGLAARGELRRHPALRALVVALAAASTALVVASLVPIGQNGHASRIDLAAGPLGIVAALLCVGMTAAMVVGSRPRRGVLGAVTVGALILVGAATAGRWGLLHASEGTGEHWMDGAYTRAGGHGPALTLTIGAGEFAIGDRWSGRWESSGWTIVLADDPACPDARGTYHAHGAGAGDRDLRFVKVVDTCADGERAADLEAGVWEREP